MRMAHDGATQQAEAGRVGALQRRALLDCSTPDDGEKLQIFHFDEEHAKKLSTFCNYNPKIEKY